MFQKCCTLSRGSQSQDPKSNLSVSRRSDWNRFEIYSVILQLERIRLGGLILKTRETYKCFTDGYEKEPDLPDMSLSFVFNFVFQFPNRFFHCLDLENYIVLKLYCISY